MCFSGQITEQALPGHGGELDTDAGHLGFAFPALHPAFQQQNVIFLSTITLLLFVSHETWVIFFFLFFF